MKTRVAWLLLLLPDKVREGRGAVWALWGHDVKVANKVLVEELGVVQNKRALVRVLFAHAEEHAYLFPLQRSGVLVRAERVEALYGGVCVCVRHAVGVEAKGPAPDVLVVGRGVHVPERLLQLVERELEEELVALHEHAPRDEEEVDAVYGGAAVGVVVLHAVAAVVEVGVGVLVLA